MAIMRFNYRSEILGCDTDIMICYPTNCITIYDEKLEEAKNSNFPQSAKFVYKDNMKFQTVWFLHGGGDDDMTSYRLTSLERYAEENQVMLVTPTATSTWYVNSINGVRCMDYITKELPLLVRSLFASSDKREDNFIMGSAMGGNGALAIGLTHPELYSAIVDLSGGIGLTLDKDVYRSQMDWMGGGLRRVLRGPDEFENTEHDLYYIAKKNIEEKKELPEIFIAAGEKDFIEYRVRKDYEHLKKLGYNVYYETAKDLGHEWDFWDMYYEKALSQWLPLKREPIYE
jgi:putative tributyrin esterase